MNRPVVINPNDGCAMKTATRPDQHDSPKHSGVALRPASLHAAWLQLSAAP